MNLQHWVQNNLDDLTSTLPDKDEAEELIRVAEREITDAGSVFSSEGKLTHAYAACLCVGRAALVLSGYRVRSGVKSHHYKAIESLEFTVGLTPDKVREIQHYRQTRHQSIYDHADTVSVGTAESALCSCRRVTEQFPPVAARKVYQGLINELLRTVHRGLALASLHQQMD